MLPFGTDQRSNPVGIPLIESTMLFGSLPGAGKTASLRCVVLGCALDPTVEMHVWELKGSGDLESLERIGHLDARDSDAVLAKPHAAREAAGAARRTGRRPHRSFDHSHTRSVVANTAPRSCPITRAGSSSRPAHR